MCIRDRGGLDQVVEVVIGQLDLAGEGPDAAEGDRSDDGEHEKDPPEPPQRIAAAVAGRRRPGQWAGRGLDEHGSYSSSERAEGGCGRFGEGRSAGVTSLGVGEPVRLPQMVPPARPTYFYQVTGHRFAAGPQFSDLGQPGQGPTGPWQAGPEGEGHRDQLIAVADRARFTGVDPKRVGHPPELRLGIADLLGGPVAPLVGLDETLTSQAVADHARAGAGPAPLVGPGRPARFTSHSLLG